MPIEVFGQEKVERPVFNQERKKTKFVDLTSTATIRILSEQRVVVDTHFINRSTVKCLGDECPICQNNKNLIMQYPDSFREEPRYSPKRQVKMVNVLDKTPVRTCPKCGNEERSSMTCKGCGEIITAAPAPSNTVKVLSRGVQLFDSLDAINNTILNELGERVGITNYDVTLVVAGSDKSRTTTPIPGQITGKVEVDPEELFDLENITITLTPTEMLELQRGISLKDIFSARKAAAKKAVDSDPFLSQDVLQSVQTDVDALFNSK